MTTAGRTALQYYVRHFPFKRGKERLLTALWKPLSFGQFRVLTMLRQADVKVNCDLTKLIQRHLFFWGSYEPEHCELWMKLAVRSQVIFDAGANIGLYALLAAKVNPRSSIHAFEPTPSIVARLHENIQLNDQHNIKVNAVAVGAKTARGFVRDCRGSDGSSEGMNFLLSDSVASGDGGLCVDVVSLDDYCRRYAIDHIDILKIDVEGGEYDALAGAENLLKSQAIDCIFIEFIEWAAKRYGHSLIELRSALENIGYRLYRLKSGNLKEARRDDTLDGENVVAAATGFNIF